MLEGWKAYVLPASAAVLLAVFFAWRCSVAERPDAPTAAGDPEPAASPRERIDAAVSAEGSAAPPLPDAYRDSVREALDPIVARCRADRPADAALPLSIRIEVAAAEGIGAIVRSTDVEGSRGSAPSKGLATCIAEGARSLALPDPAATGVGTYDLELPP